MKRVSFGLVVLALFVPVGLRVLSWPGVSPTNLDAAEVAEGKTLFNHAWQPNDPLAGGDGVGPVFNANSCVACHFQGGVGGSGGLKENVTTYVSIVGGRTIAGILHADATSPEFLETLDRLEAGLPHESRPTLAFLSGLRSGRFAGGSAVFSQRNTPALFGARLIDEIPDREIIALARRQQLAAGLIGESTETQPVGRILFTKEGQVGRFGWKGQTPNLLAFVQGACANELGLSNPSQPQPVSISQPGYQAPPGNDLTLKQCQQMASYIASLAPPRRELPKDAAQLADIYRGEAEFNSMGCAACHVPNVASVQGIYSDLLLHRMGERLESQGHYYAPPADGDPVSTPRPDEWRTPPLWGVADSAPYMHDGRAATLREAILMHGGQAAASMQRFERANREQQDQLIGFLNSLRAPAAN